MTGVLKPTDGEAVFKGERISGLPVHEVVQRGISRTFQLTHLFPQLSARENVRIAAQAKLDGRWTMMGGGAVLAASRRLADAALERLRLTRLGDTPARNLSHGDQRLLEIAMAVAQKPTLLMLDEPTQGLSIEETEHAVGILQQMLAGGDLTVILVEHDMEVVFKLAHKITVLHRGQVIADGTPDEMKANAEVQSAYLGGFE
jgi:branched-chain amino acid transport system ATP-binding protein